MSKPIQIQKTMCEHCPFRLEGTNSQWRLDGMKADILNRNGGEFPDARPCHVAKVAKCRGYHEFVNLAELMGSA